MLQKLFFSAVALSIWLRTVLRQCAVSPYAGSLCKFNDPVGSTPSGSNFCQFIWLTRSDKRISLWDVLFFRTPQNVLFALHKDATLRRQCVHLFVPKSIIKCWFTLNKNVFPFLFSDGYCRLKKALRVSFDA